jgi:hypothetical protein
MSGFDFPIRRISGRKTEKEPPSRPGAKIERNRIRRRKMARFMYLFRSNPTAYRSMSPEQMQQTMKKGPRLEE